MSSGSQPVDPRGEDRLHRGGHVDRVEGPGESIGPALPREGVRLDQRPHALLEEERIAAGPGDEDWLERLDGGVGAQQGQEQLAGALGRQRVQTELGVVGLAPPAMLVLRPVVDQEEQPRGRQALDQAVQERLRLGVDPVQILEDHEQRLHLALAEQQALDGVEGPLAALRRIEGLPLARPRRARRAAPAGRAASARGPGPA